MFQSLRDNWTLFFGLLLIMAGNGLQLVLLGLRAGAADYSTIMTGVMMGGYFLGLFLGSIIVPKLLSDVGHIRLFGALAAVASAIVLMHTLTLSPFIWAILRIISGVCYAGMYIIVESWLNEKATNETRGQILSLYMIITMAGMGAGQLLSGLDDGISTQLFLIASILVSIAVVPILITVAKAPDFSEPERISLRRLYGISPLAMLAMLLQGVTASMMFGMGPTFGNSVGMTANQVSYFMVAVTVGTVILQFPVGRLSDLLDRRLVILIVSTAACLTAFLGTQFGMQNYWLLVLVMGVHGGLSISLYSLAIAHANDYLTPRQMVATASALIMVNGMGAIIGSPLVAAAMDRLGSGAYFGIIAIINLSLAGFVLWRMFASPATPAEAQGPFVAVPEAGTAVALTLNPETAWIATDEESEIEADPLADNPYFPAPSSSDQT